MQSARQGSWLKRKSRDIGEADLKQHADVGPSGSYCQEKPRNGGRAAGGDAVVSEAVIPCWCAVGDEPAGKEDTETCPRRVLEQQQGGSAGKRGHWLWTDSPANVVFLCPLNQKAAVDGIGKREQHGLQVWGRQAGPGGGSKVGWGGNEWPVWATPILK